MKIGSCTVAPGELSYGRLRPSPDDRELEIPLAVAAGKKPGKHVFISAGMHGNEINGIELLQRLLSQLDPKQIAGTIIFIPVLNPWGFQQRIRYVSLDNMDLNRCFPGSWKGSQSSRIARGIFEHVIKRCQFGIDLHDAGDRNILLPHCRVHQNEVDGCTRELGGIFGTDIIMERVGKTGMMAVETHRLLGIPVLTVETGGGLVIWNNFIEEGIRGVKNILRHIGVIPGVPIIPERQFLLSSRERYKASISGVLELEVALGDPVEKGQSLGRIYDPVSMKEEQVVAKYSGIVFSTRLKSTIEKGDTVLSIMEFEPHKEHNLKPVNSKMIVNHPSKGTRIRTSHIWKKILSLKL